MCKCGKVVTMKHIISCCPHRAALKTKRHNNVARILVQAIEVCNRKELIKSTTEQYIHWNQEIKLPDEIRDPRRNPDIFDERVAIRRPDIWYYTKVKKGNVKELNLNLIELTIPWNDVTINLEKFQAEGDVKN
jgi:hypothetical protein